MKFKAPIITLGAGLVVAGVLYALNVDLTNDVARNNASATQTPTTASSQTVTKAAEPPPPSAAPSSAPAPAAGNGNGNGNAAQQGTVTYAGAVDSGAASLGIVVNNGKAIAYVCDGKAAEAWLDGSMANGVISLKSPKGSLTGTYANGQVKGTVTAGSKTWGFTIKAVAPPSGLYRSQSSLRNKLDASWVLLPNGVQVGVENDGGTPKPARSFDVNTKTANVDGTSIPVEASSPATGN
jgi:serine/threonine-protein kinase